MLSECKTNESSVWIWVLVSMMLLALAGGIGGTIFYFYRKKGELCTKPKKDVNSGL